MNSGQIRKVFLDFFRSKGHQIVSSAPLVVKDDPTLMFTNAGMNQFKDMFLGNKSPQHKRVADTQKCLRVSGKHNDLEEVGIDTYHHTMFEMLGNWSFGDYFKKEAIEWAWELLTMEYKLPKDRLYVTVFGGDQKENLEPDSEAFGIWEKIIGKERVLFGSKKDNFWEMGDTGPCGPCSEIHIDLRSDSDIKKKAGKDLVNTGHPLVIEIWNLVFIQYNRNNAGDLNPLPEKHVDTGMGFERLVMAIQGKYSNYDTDVFQPLIRAIEKESGINYGENEKTDIAMRVIADHIRAITFAVADGQLPSNVKAGYVIRRILRRAVRYGFTYLHFNKPVIYSLVKIMAGQFSDTFPEVAAQEEFISKVIAEEETSFLRTLENGLKRFDQIKSQLDPGTKVLDGKIVFELYDTFGFPVDLTALIARENDLTLDEKGFKEAMEEQKDRSKQASLQETGDWNIVNADSGVEFIGYDHLTAKSHILRYREIISKNKKQYQLVLDKTPFYAESGGQVGDTGYLQHNGEKIYILDTKKENDLIVHYSDKLPSDPAAEFTAVVNGIKRNLTENNHSATHLLHAALRNVLGHHVQQKGSLVNEKILRFDFSHFAKMTPEEISRVEQIVNEKIREDIRLNEKINVPIDEAKAMGAMALFGEKYGDHVRVITFDRDYSVELCGGTHVPATGRIGFFKIVSESSIAAGVRRIEAVTALEAEKYINEKLELLNRISDNLKNPRDLEVAVNNLLKEKDDLTRELESLKAEKAGDLKDELIKKAVNAGSIHVIIEDIGEQDPATVKNLAFQIKQQFEPLFLVLANINNGKPQLTVMLSDTVMSENKLDASVIVRELAREISGGGGGQPFYATAGGKNVSGIAEALKKARGYISVKA